MWIVWLTSCWGLRDDLFNDYFLTSLMSAHVLVAGYSSISSRSSAEMEGSTSRRRYGNSFCPRYWGYWRSFTIILKLTHLLSSRSPCRTTTPVPPPPPISAATRMPPQSLHPYPHSAHHSRPGAFHSSSFQALPVEVPPEEPNAPFISDDLRFVAIWRLCF